MFMIRGSITGSALLAVLAVAGCGADSDGDGVADRNDCGPDDPRVYAGAHEFCDGLDNDCDHVADETFDLDGDGALADDADCRVLGQPTDCDDLDPAVHPGAPEVCDGLDNDCSDRIDDDVDADGDGYFACADCDDADPYTHPDAAEVCDGIDNDCSGASDETWDLDGDGYSPCAGDCNDRDPHDAPGIPELCDGHDNNCDGTADEGFDEDGDGWRVCDGDCDDTSADINPTATEICDDLDNDCDGVIADRDDLDGDGYTICSGDCMEGERDAYPGAEEVCDRIDNDCDGKTDDQPECHDCDVLSDSYWVCREGMDWSTGEGVCEGFGGTLAVITSTEENDLVMDGVADASRYQCFWLGLDDTDTEGTFVWVDGSPLTFTGWASSEPSDVWGYEDCVGTQSYGGIGWADYGCTNWCGFVCEFPPR
jgi:hypothetical protein